MLRFPIYLNGKDLWCLRASCKRKPFTEGLCQSHWIELCRRDDPSYRRRNRPPKPCKVDGCSDTAQRKGYCDKHYIRVRKHGNSSVVLVRRGDSLYPHGKMPKTCINKDCTKPTLSAGLCNTHYKQHYRWGTHGAPQQYEDCPVCRHRRYRITTGRDMCYLCFRAADDRKSRKIKPNGYWDRDTCLRAGRAWYEQTGYAPRTTHWRSVGLYSNFPHSDTVYRLFGSWGAFINELGLPLPPIHK
jgi:hypothetical protein